MTDLQRGGATAVVTDRPSIYRYTLEMLVFPFAAHVFFNALPAACFALIGHGGLGLALFVTGCTLDFAQQTLVRRWKQQAEVDRSLARMGQVYALCAARMIAGMTPIVVLAATGGVAEMAMAGIQVISMLAIGQAMGGVSRGLFWAYAGPALASLVAIVLLRLPPAMLGGTLLALANCGLVLWLISGNLNRVVVAWRHEFDAKTAAVVEMEAARDEARHANRAKSNFLATMSHEIRTPMNGVLGMAQLLQRDERDPVQKERLNVLIDSGEYLLAILNDILDVSKIDAGRLELVEQPEALRPFLDRAVGFWAARAHEKGVILSLDTGALPDWVLLDQLRLRQVLFNLIGNALKFTDKGRVEVTAHASAAGDDRVQVRLAVRDTGVGIAPEHLPNLFERFSQADESEMRRFGGTGLGLAIAKQLVELMGGRIWADSELGRGSTFHVELMLEVAETPDAIADVTETVEPGLGDLRVLAVDDNAVNLMVLEQLLGSLGCQITKAASGEEALSLLGGQVFDLVLMDIQMPGMTGFDAVHRLRSEAGPNRDAPVVALTADVTSGGRERYVSMGFTDHTSKPIQLGELLGAMSRALAVPRASQAA